MRSRQIGHVGGIDGLSKSAAAKRVNALIGNAAPGIYRDTDWAGVKRVWAALATAGVDYTMASATYQTNADNTPISKTWTFVIDFNDNNGKPRKLFGRVVAAGAGSVRDPLDAYDVVATVG